MQFSLVLALVPAALALNYEVPSALLADLAATSLSNSMSSSSSSHAAAAQSESTSDSASCTYPDAYTIFNFHSTSITNSTDSYISFTYTDYDTDIISTCIYNASSVSLTTGTSLAPRYACNDNDVSFIWQSGKLNMIEVACPGETTTVWQAYGSVIPAEHNLRCTTDNTTLITSCAALVPFSANFTSLEPSTSTATKARRTFHERRIRRSSNLF